MNPGAELMVDDNIIYIGKKETMSYVLAVTGQLNGEAGKVTIKARGRSISKAVDVAEITRNKVITTAVVDDIKIYTENLENDDGRKTNVSSIEILLKKE